MRLMCRKYSAPPLVVRVDAPDDALHEDLLLVHGDQHAQREWCELLEEDRVRRPVAREQLPNKRRESELSCTILPVQTIRVRVH